MPDAFDDATTVREIAIRLEGKIDALAAKLDGRLDAVMAKIEAGDRESLQLFKLQENELGHLADTVRANTARIAAVDAESRVRDSDVEREVEAARHDLTDQFEKLKSDLSDFPTVRKLVYSGVGLVLVMFLTALVAVVIVQP